MEKHKEYRRTTPQNPHLEQEETPASDTRRMASSSLRHRADEVLDEETRTIPLREEELVAEKQQRQVGEVLVRKEVEEVPGRLEVDASREEIEVQHVPIGQFVDQRKAPWQDGETFVLPIYEEQLVLAKRLVLKEEVRIRRVHTTERRLFEDNLRRERPVIEDHTGRDAVRERYPSDEIEGTIDEDAGAIHESEDRPGPLDRLARKILD